MLPPSRFLVALLGVAWVGPAIADEEPPPVRDVAPPAKSEPAPSHEVDPTSDDEPVDGYGTASSEPEPESKSRQDVSLFVGSPMWLSNAPLDPGIEIEARNGYKYGVLVPEIALGGRWNWVNVDGLRQAFPGVLDPERYQGEYVFAVWFSAGLRFEPKERQELMPYGSVAFDMNFWSASTSTSDLCGAFACVITDKVEFAPGFSGRLGVRWNPGPAFGLELGAKLGMTFPGWAFTSSHAWVEPYVGFTFVPIQAK